MQVHVEIEGINRYIQYVVVGYLEALIECFFWGGGGWERNSHQDGICSSPFRNIEIYMYLYN